MLYDKDDFEAQEYGLIKREKLNLKKVAIFIAIVFACFLIIFGSFYISYINLNKEYFSGESQAQTQKEEQKIESQQKQTSKEEKKKDKNSKYYEGEHVQIAVHDTSKIMTKFVPEANPNGQELIKNIYYSETKEVYLTFDDGPSKNITPQVLDILKAHDVKATFFVLGARVDLYPETLKRVFNEGHYIANHGYSHEYSSIYQNRDTVFQEYVDCENSIKRALNNDDYNSYLFRFPGGSTGGRYASVKAEAREHLSNYGIAYTNWNCLNGDAEGKETKEECIQEFFDTKGEQKGLIVLMHDSNDKQYTVDALPDIIQYLKNEGYVFKTFYEIYK